jgi:hypothetical protein
VYADTTLETVAAGGHTGKVAKTRDFAHLSVHWLKRSFREPKNTILWKTRAGTDSQISVFIHLIHYKA